jgi:hypothetical protein
LGVLFLPAIPPRAQFISIERLRTDFLAPVASYICCASEIAALFRSASNVMRANRINSAIVTCLEHVATSTAPPGAGAADFLLKLLDDGVFAIEEVDEITRRVSIILRGITERHQLIESPVALNDQPVPPPVIVPVSGADDGRARVTRPKTDYQKATAELRRGTDA